MGVSTLENSLILKDGATSLALVRRLEIIEATIIGTIVEFKLRVS